MSSQIPFTVDHVGSFLRPETIKKARKKVQAGALSQAELRLIEDEEIKAYNSDLQEIGADSDDDEEDIPQIEEDLTIIDDDDVEDEDDFDDEYSEE